MATQTQAENAKYRSEKRFTDSTKETFKDYWVRCYDKNKNYSEWADTVSAADADDETLLANAIIEFKANCEEKAIQGREIDKQKGLN